MRNHFLRSTVAIISVVTLLTSVATDTYAQFDSLGLNMKWRNGSIVLEDDSHLKGLVRFNDKLGMIKFKQTHESEEQSFVETSIVAMEIYDDEMGGWRHFAVFNVNEVQTGRQGALLFEVLMEFKSFALLARVERVTIGMRARQDGFGNIYYKRVGYEQFEHLCLINEEGTAKVVLSVSEFERYKWSMASKLKPVLDKNALQKYLADDWDDFQSLVKSHKLNLRKRDDFIRAFEYYEELVEGRL